MRERACAWDSRAARATFGYPPSTSTTTTVHRPPLACDGRRDLLCPDCAGAWPTLLQVTEHYGPAKLQFLLHVL